MEDLFFKCWNLKQILEEFLKDFSKINVKNEQAKIKSALIPYVTKKCFGSIGAFRVIPFLMSNILGWGVVWFF